MSRSGQLIATAALDIIRKQSHQPLCHLSCLAQFLVAKEDLRLLLERRDVVGMFLQPSRQRPRIIAVQFLIRLRPVRLRCQLLGRIANVFHEGRLELLHAHRVLADGFIDAHAFREIAEDGAELLHAIGLDEVVHGLG